PGRRSRLSSLRRVGLGLMFLGAAAMAAMASSNSPSLLAPGVVSTGDSESHPVLSPDGRTLYFVKLSPDFAHWTVVASDRTTSGWGHPSVAWFSGRWDD